MACVGPIDASLPPRCGGPELIGWEWPAESESSPDRTRWVSASFRARYDIDARTLTVVGDISRSSEPTEAVGHVPPPQRCEPPAGGWPPVDQPGQMEAYGRLLQTRLERRAEVVAAAYLLRDGVPMVEIAVGPDVDAAALHDELAAIYPYPLCVWRSNGLRLDEREAILSHFVAAMGSAPDGMRVLTAGDDPGEARVEVSVEFDDGRFQAAADERWGAGAVRIESALVVLDG